MEDIYVAKTTLTRHERIKNYMENSTYFRICQYFINIVCIIAFLYLLISCTHEYILNKDITTVSFKEFHADDDNIYPSVSLCFADVFDKINEDSDSIDYRSFLSGCEVQTRFNITCKWNESFSDIK